MTLGRAMEILRFNLMDEQRVGWPNDIELLEYLDRASYFLTDRLIMMRYNALIKRIYIDDQLSSIVPPDFVAFVGKVPIRVVGDRFVVYGKQDKRRDAMYWDDANTPPTDAGLQWNYDPDAPKGGVVGQDPADYTYVSKDDQTKEKISYAYYWSKLPYPSQYVLSDELPYQPEHVSLIIEIARMFALNRNEYDLTQDQGLLNTIQQGMASSRGQAEVG